MRTHLSKSLQVRCKTIRKAITQYNAAANACDPPRPTVDWSQVSHYGFLEQFTLLQDTRNDVREKQWTKPAVRETLKLYRRVARAREEIIRLNVEARRVHTAIVDEAVLFKKTLDLIPLNDPLHGAVQDFTVRRCNINGYILHCLRKLYALPGFSGAKEPGRRLGTAEEDVEMTGVDVDGSRADVGVLGKGDGDVEDGDEEDDDAVDEDDGEEMFALVSFISELAVA